MLKAPPSAGKASRRASVEQRGRNTSVDLTPARLSTISPPIGGIPENSRAPASANSPFDMLQVSSPPTRVSSAPPPSSSPPMRQSTPQPQPRQSAPFQPAPAPASSADPWADTFSSSFEQQAKIDDPFSSAPPASDPFSSPAATGSRNDFDFFMNDSKPATTRPASNSTASRPSASSPTTRPTSGSTATAPPSSASSPPASRPSQSTSPKKKKKKAGSDSSKSGSDSDSGSSSDDEKKDAKRQGDTKSQEAQIALQMRKRQALQQQAQDEVAASGGPASPTSAQASMPLMKINCLAYMKKGTPFLKYGKRGYPHFRQFQVSEDNQRIVWFSKAKKMKDTQISIREINEIRLGQTTANFARHKAPELARSSFSILYSNRSQSLDLIAKDPNEYKIWTEGLRELLKRSKAGALTSNEREIVVQIAVVRNRRSSIDIVDHVTGQTADAIGGVDPEEEKKAPTTGNKQMYKPVAKNFAELKRKLAKYKEQLRDQRYYMSTQYEAMKNIIRNVEASVVRINDWFQNGEYPACDDEIWRAGVDLEGLRNMMKAIG